MSQRVKILKHLQSGSSITPLTALGLFGCFRLSARVLELRREGHNIETIIKTDGQGRSFARYKLLQ